MRVARRMAGPMMCLMVLAACGPRTGGQPPAAADTPVAAAPTKLTVAYAENVFSNLPFWMAQEAGIFQKNGLDVDFQQVNSSNAVAALLAGQVQLSMVGGSETLSANANGADLVVVGTLGAVYPYVLMVQPSITSPDELRGKKIGVSAPGSASDTATRITLRRLSLDPDKDVTIVPVGSTANRTAAMLSGSIDAGLDTPPGSFAEEAQGLRQLLSLADLKLPTSTNAIVLQRSFVEQHRDTVQRYVDSIVEATQRIRTDRDLSIKILKDKYQSTDDEMMGGTYDFEVNTMPDLPYPRPEQFADAVDQLGSKNEQVKSYDVASMLDPSFVDSAAARHVGGVQGA